MAAREIHHLRHLGFGDLMAKDPDNGHALLVHHQHDLESLCMGHAKEPLENMHDEFHRRIVVVQQQYLVERRSLRPRPRLGRDTDLTIGLVVAIIGHQDLLQAGQGARRSGLRGLSASLGVI